VPACAASTILTSFSSASALSGGSESPWLTDGLAHCCSSDPTFLRISLTCFSESQFFRWESSHKQRKKVITFSRFALDGNHEEEEEEEECELRAGGGAEEASVEVGTLEKLGVGMGQVMGASPTVKGALGGPPLRNGCSLGGEEAISESSLFLVVRGAAGIVGSELGATMEG